MKEIQSFTFYKNYYDILKYLKDDELTINLSAYIKEFLFNTDDYINFKNDNSFWHSCLFLSFRQCSFNRFFYCK